MTELKNFNALSLKEKEKVKQALDVLCTEENIGDKLTALAHLKTTKPLMWKIALKKLGA